MKSFNVQITETLQRTVTVEALNYNEALTLVRVVWKKSQYVLDADDFIEAAFEVIGPVCS